MKRTTLTSHRGVTIDGADKPTGEIVQGPSSRANRLRTVAPMPPALTSGDRLFDALFVPCDPNAPPTDEECYLCGKTSAEGCRCWVRLRCALCDDTISVQRVVAEDGDEDEVVTLCPDCAPDRSPPAT